MAMTKPKVSKVKKAEEKASSPKKHSDAKQDMKLIKVKVKKSCMK
jgi:hypothetical protein